MVSDMLITLLWFGELYSEVKVFLVLVGFITLLWILAKWLESKLQATDDSDVRSTDGSRVQAQGGSRVWATNGSRERATNVRTTDESNEQATNEFKGVLNAEKLSSKLTAVVNWFQLGLNLGLLKYDLDKIQQKNHENDRQRLEMLDLWLRRTPNAAMGDVVSALKQMGENRIAEDICPKDKGEGK